MDRPLTRHDYRTLSLAALGGALEFYGYVGGLAILGMLLALAPMSDSYKT